MRVANDAVARHLETLHPEDRAEIAAADAQIARADDLDRAYKAAAQCLMGAM